MAPEILFNPELIGQEYPGVHQVIVDSINRTDLDLRKALFSNIVLSGGSTLCTGQLDSPLSPRQLLTHRIWGQTVKRGEKVSSERRQVEDLCSTRTKSELWPVIQGTKLTWAVFHLDRWKYPGRTEYIQEGRLVPFQRALMGTDG